ncbi:MAG: type II secretion system F family protein [Pirellulaceae bacterium]
MPFQIVIIIAVFAGVAALVAGVAFLFSGRSNTDVEDRLQLLTAGGGTGLKREGGDDATLLASPLDESVSFAEALFSRFGSLQNLIAQAGLNMAPTHFLLVVVGMAGLGALACLLTGIPALFAPVLALMTGVLPFLFVIFKRKRRMAAFARQLPDALELIGRALRAGHSLASGFSLVGDEMAEPISKEFARSFEEQNLGISLDESLEGMTQRVPNLDLRFFATAVILQRTTGGDLAEILDKIGHLVRERFKIWGQIQALTGEGRLSGIVLLALPPVLFIVMYRLNPEYSTLLFTDPMGQQMLGGAIVLQLVGALVIRKIINIKV